MTGQWFSLLTPVSSTNKTVRHDITEILLKVALYTIKPNQNLSYIDFFFDILYIIHKLKYQILTWNNSELIHLIEYNERPLDAEFCFGIQGLKGILAWNYYSLSLTVVSIHTSTLLSGMYINSLFIHKGPFIDCHIAINDGNCWGQYGNLCFIL